MFTPSTTGISISHSSNGVSITGNGINSDHFASLDIPMPTNYELSVEITGIIISNKYSAGISCEGIFCETSGNNLNWGRIVDLGGNVTSTSPILKVGDTLKFIVNNGVVTCYLNNTQKYQKQADSSNHSGFKIKLYSNRNVTIKNMVITKL
ncbi:MAG: hypothetical protein IJH63_00465 [Methanobrevibacter sp.]|nr:hypothetical protein [Methanosphaera sp.]MBR0369176.1 hypothetical protein [Methanobrevibacter sp.]